MNQPPLKIAILGTRGVPARYGGFETFAEELGVRLGERGHEVTIYCRRFFNEPKRADESYRGMRQRWIPTLRHKYFETPIHSLISFFNLFTWKPDVVLLCNAANSPFAWLVRLRFLPLAINVDGIERMRTKWNALGRAWYRLGEKCSVLFASRVVADARVIADYYLKNYRCSSTVIAYGAKVDRLPPAKIHAELNIEPKKFILYVSRLEPENNALGVIEAYGKSNSTLPLVIVGDAPYSSKYKAELKRAADAVMQKNSLMRVIFAGFRFGEEYKELRTNCGLYIQATEVGGTHPALVEAMAYGNCIIANGTPENVEVLDGAGEFYPKNDFNALAKLIDLLMSKPDRMTQLAMLASERAAQLYTWDHVTDQYEKLFYELVK